MEEDVERIFNIDKVNLAIDQVFQVFVDNELTVAESIHVARTVDAALKSEYAGAYELLALTKNNG